MMEFGFGGFGPRPGGPGAAAKKAMRQAEGEEGRPGGFGGVRAVVAAAGPRQGLGLRHHRPQQHPGRQRRGPDQGDHRPVQQGAAPQARRLGCAARLGLGGQPRPRLLRDRQGRRRQAGRDRGALALRQGGARGDGLRPAVRHRLHRLLGRGRGQAASPQLRRAGREPHRLGRIPLDGRELPQVRRPADAGRSAGGRPRADRPVRPAARPSSATGHRPARGPRGSGSTSAGSFMAAVAAGPVFKLLGKKDLGTRNSPRSRRRSPMANSPSASTRGATPPARTGRRSWRSPIATSSFRPRHRAAGNGQALIDPNVPRPRTRKREFQKGGHSVFSHEAFGQSDFSKERYVPLYFRPPLFLTITGNLRSWRMVYSSSPQ